VKDADFDQLCADCSESRWEGNFRHCRWCNQPLTPRRLRWCSATCLDEWRENHVWNYARSAVRARDGNRCLACLDRHPVVHVHHRQPCQGVRTISCLHHLANLETLCAGCHQDEHRERAA
jgi:hypothetical protein